MPAIKLPYRLEPGEAPGSRFLAIARSLNDRIVEDIEGAEGDELESAYGARKKLKRMRAVFRLMRYVDPDAYDAENQRCRDAGRALGPFRDRDVEGRALDELVAHFAPALDEGLFDHLRERLAARRASEALADSGIRAALNFARAHAHLTRATLSALNWQKIDAKPIVKSVVGDYKKARKLKAKVAAHRIHEDAHQMRKYIKYHWLHVRLLRPVWPGDYRHYQAQLRSIVDDLGALQDIEVLAGALAPINLSQSETRLLHALIEARSKALLDSAIQGTAIALDAKPKQLVFALEDALSGFIAAVNEQEQGAIAS